MQADGTRLNGRENIYMSYILVRRNIDKWLPLELSTPCPPQQSEGKRWLSVGEGGVKGIEVCSLDSVQEAITHCLRDQEKQCQVLTNYYRACDGSHLTKSERLVDLQTNRILKMLDPCM